MPLSFRDTDIPGVVVIEPQIFEDSRGFFMETLKRSELVAAGLEADFVQENHSLSRRGTVRGLHFQNPPAAQAKLVRAVVGDVFDVAVDIRTGSPTFGAWTSVLLSGDNKSSLYIPPWCAHGFCVLSETAEVIYKTTAEYAPALEGGILWNDPEIGIPWPIESPTLSERDGQLPRLRDCISLFRA